MSPDWGVTLLILLLKCQLSRVNPENFQRGLSNDLFFILKLQPKESWNPLPPLDIPSLPPSDTPSLLQINLPSFRCPTDYTNKLYFLWQWIAGMVRMMNLWFTMVTLWPLRSFSGMFYLPLRIMPFRPHRKFYS